MTSLAYTDSMHASASRAQQLEDADVMEDSKPRHECGVFGTWSSQKNASRVAVR